MSPVSPGSRWVFRLLTGLESQREHLTLFALLRTIEEKRLPPTVVVFYQEEDGAVPLLEWIDRLPAKVRAKCLAHLKRLEDLGHELRRPEADYLRDGIHELRASLGGVHYRILYFSIGTSPRWFRMASPKSNASPRERSSGRSSEKTNLLRTRRATRFDRSVHDGSQKAVHIRRAPICL
jgi:hypothetical protein